MTFGHSNSPLLTRCAGLLSGVLILVALGASCQLKFVKFDTASPSRIEGRLRVQKWMLCWVPCSGPDDFL